MNKIDKEVEAQRKEVYSYFNQYWKHSSSLRNWFVTYGVGALVLVLYNNGSFFSNSIHKKYFVLSIIIGICLQILLTFLNKVVHWFVYYGKNLGSFQKTKRYKWANNVSKNFWIDIVADVFTMVCYSIAFILFIKNL